MKLTVHLEGKNKAELLAGLQAHMALFGTTAATTTTTPAKTTKAKKAAAPADEEEEEFDLDDADDSDDEEELEASDDSDEEEEEAEDDSDEEEEEATLTLTDVITAFQKYAKKNSREKAAKVLAKFKAKSTKDIKKADYAKVMAALK